MSNAYIPLELIPFVNVIEEQLACILGFEITSPTTTVINMPLLNFAAHIHRINIEDDDVDDGDDEDDCEDEDKKISEAEFIEQNQHWKPDLLLLHRGLHYGTDTFTAEELARFKPLKEKALGDFRKFIEEGSQPLSPEHQAAIEAEITEIFSADDFELTQDHFEALSALFGMTVTGETYLYTIARFLQQRKLAN